MKQLADIIAQKASAAANGELFITITADEIEKFLPPLQNIVTELELDFMSIAKDVKTESRREFNQRSIV